MEYSVYPKNVSVWSLDIVGLRWEPLGTNQLYLYVCVCVCVRVCVLVWLTLCVLYMCMCMCAMVCGRTENKVLFLPSNLTYLEAEEHRETLPQLPAMIDMGC